jgi:D-alanine-D-alanine ligase
VVVRDADWRLDPDACIARVTSLTPPWFVKPSRGGSSVGISRVVDVAGLAAAVDEARLYDPHVIAAQGLTDVHEVECAVLGTPGGDIPQASLPGEVVVHTDTKFYDFATKYLPDQPLTLDIPAQLPPEVIERVRTLAVEAFAALGAEGLARVDTFVLANGDVVLNELNTMPGFTATSMYPKLWEATGVDYTALVSRLLELALERPLGLR